LTASLRFPLASFPITAVDFGEALVSKLPVEDIKAASGHLRGPLADELTDPDTPFSDQAAAVLKFHGIYQQDDRDQRRALTAARRPVAYSCMVRCAVPGGTLRPEQWRAVDDLADRVGDGTLRLTTRQGIQYHFVHKGDLRRLVGELNRSLVTTYAACGDVVRNVMAATAPVPGRDHERLGSLARALAGRFRPRSAAYWELWVDGERMVSAGPPAAEVEPIYGDTYLPRKFKVAIAWPGDNSVDVFSQDVGLVPAEGPGGDDGVVVLVGGGLGRSHNDPTTFPRLADPLVWVPDADVPDVVEAVVTAFRDHGNRQDRSHARLKYVIEDRGVAWFRAEVERRVGRPLPDPVPLGPWQDADHLGWHVQDDGRWFLGLPVPTGRLADRDGVRRRSAVRRILDDRLADEVRITPRQDLLLCGVRGRDRRRVGQVLADHRVPTVEALPLVVRSSMACPALPTCGQALGEAERVLPDITDLLGRLLAERHLAGVRIETRVTGCPNGCARPYVAELGIVARTKTAYDLWLGGDAAGTRLAAPVTEGVPLPKLGDVLGPVLDRFAAQRRPGESFGDWAQRVDRAELAASLPSFDRRSGAGARS
jgi:sulfite reductase (ferredoxin)